MIISFITTLMAINKFKPEMFFYIYFLKSVGRKVATKLTGKMATRLS